jgi:hypothetical protein
MADINPKHASIERCRELLGDEAVGVSEKHIATIRDHADTMAHLIVDLLLEQRLRLNENDDDISRIR